MAFSVQLAADCMSTPAPRTVLQAAIASPPPISIKVIVFRSKFTLPKWSGQKSAGHLTPA